MSGAKRCDGQSTQSSAHQYLLPRDAMLARYMLWRYDLLSLCLSVTNRPNRYIPTW